MPEPTNASLIDADIDGTWAASAKEPRKAPWYFTPAAKEQWLKAYDRIVAMREDNESGYGVMTYSRRVEEVAVKVVRKEATPSDLTAAIRESAEEISQAILRQVERARCAG